MSNGKIKSLGMMLITIPVLILLILLIYCMECLFVLQFAGQDEMLWEVQRKVTLLKRKVSIKLLTL